jgi:two-component system, cell cycle response regulator DivK
MELLIPTGSSRGAMRALLAERDVDTRQMYGEFLRQSRVDLEEAADGPEALAKALAHPYDVIVTETMLPGINGYELCQLLRHDPATRRTPIIVVTAESFAPNLERARKAGADAVLVKPCLPNTLLAEIRRVTERAGGPPKVATEAASPTPAHATRANGVPAKPPSPRRRALSRIYARQETTTPPAQPPDLICPVCERPLAYSRSHVGGVSERHREQWDYYECANGCGRFQYRARTRKLKRVG